MKDRIKALLGAGLSETLVATAVGCDASYISQLLADPVFAEDVASLRVQEIETLRARDSKYDKLEDAFLERLEMLLPMMLKPRDVLSALQTINSAKRRAAPLLETQPTHVTQNVVVLQLPSKTVNTFELNKQKEIVAIDEKPLTAMPTQALMRLIEAQNEAEKSSNDKASPPTEKNLRIPEKVNERLVTENSV